MHDQNQVQHLNQNAQVPTFFIPNVPQTVNGIQSNQQILLSQPNNFMRMPISSVGQWTVNNVLSTGQLGNNISHQMQNMQAPRILFSQSANNEHFIVQNRNDLNNQTIGVNQRFNLAHSFVVTQQLPNQIKQFTVSPSPIQITNQNNNNPGLLSVANPITTNLSPKQDGVITQIIQSPQIEKSNLTNINTNLVNTLQENTKLKNPLSSINEKRLLELSQGLDPFLQLDDDMQEIFNSFLEDFLFQVTEKAIDLAKLRKSSCLETKDFQYIFEHDWDIFVPGYQSMIEKPKKSTECEIHKLRMALIKKQCKK